MDFPFSYRNGNCLVTIHSDGTKIREYEGIAFPEFAESIDLKITNYCDAGCAWCHENSTTEGKHANWEFLQNLIYQIHEGTEIAIGGGDPMQYKTCDTDTEFEGIKKVLLECKKRNIIANITVNGKHFPKYENVLKEFVNSGLLYGIGISYNGNVYNWNYPNIVYHIISCVHPIDSFVKLKNKKVLILGYKTFGRGIKYDEKRHINQNLKNWQVEALSVAPAFVKTLAFDTLSIQQFGLKTDNNNFMGEEGSFSFYVDAVKEQYTISSYNEFRYPFISMEDSFNNVKTNINQI